MRLFFAGDLNNILRANSKVTCCLVKEANAATRTNAPSSILMLQTGREAIKSNTSSLDMVLACCSAFFLIWQF